MNPLETKKRRPRQKGDVSNLRGVSGKLCLNHSTAEPHVQDVFTNLNVESCPLDCGGDAVVVRAGRSPIWRCLVCNLEFGVTIGGKGVAK